MIITSKFAGSCKRCAKLISIGQQVSWTKGIRGVECCREDGTPIDSRPTDPAEIAAKTIASRAVDANITIPAPDGLDYLPYQRGGVAYCMAAAEGTLLGDEMGLGKTIQAIGLINADPSIKKVLIICPKSLTLNWRRELTKWLVRDMQITRVMYEQSTTAITISSYEEAKKYLTGLKDRKWDLVIVDEAHLIKNEKAQRTKAVHEIAKTARMKVALTGTPIANRPVELFSLLKLVAPKAWDPNGKGFFPFALRYCGAYRDRFGWNMKGATHLPELQEKLRSTCMVRRLKSEVLTELPAKRRQVVVLESDDCAEEVRAEARAWAQREEDMERLKVQVELARADDDPESYTGAVGKLRAAAAAAFAEISRLRHQTAVAKIPQVVEHVRAAIEEDDGKKIIVFGHHHDVIDGIMAGLADFNPVKLTGQTELEDRQRAVDAFQRDPAVRVFVGGIQAAGVGITLTAAAHVVFAELDWVPGNVTQSEDRAHRIGQTESVLIQHLVLDGSLDARMAQILIEKQAVMDKSLDLKSDPEEKDEPALPMDRPATEGKRKDLELVAARLSDAHVAQIHGALQRLAGMCDGASTMDGHGFSKIDVRIGHSLAESRRLSLKQAALGLRLVRKYRRQLGELAVLQEVA